MAYTPIVATLGYLVADGRVLLVHRGREGDVHAGKWNGLGGKLEPDEDVYSCLCRELRRRPDHGHVRPAARHGLLAGFGTGGEDWFGFLFVVNAWEGALPERNADGPLVWHSIDELDGLPMWEGGPELPAAGLRRRAYLPRGDALRGRGARGLELHDLRLTGLPRTVAQACV